MKKISPITNDETQRSSDSSLHERQENLKNFSPLQAIKAYCKDCSGGSSAEVKLCPKDGVQSALCPLFRYRTGKTGRKRELTEEQRQERSQRMKDYLANRRAI